jgi:hypothetical protein
VVAVSWVLLRSMMQVRFRFSCVLLGEAGFTCDMFLVTGCPWSSRRTLFEYFVL